MVTPSHLGPHPFHHGLRHHVSHGNVLRQIPDLKSLKFRALKRLKAVGDIARRRAFVKACVVGMPEFVFLNGLAVKSSAADHLSLVKFVFA